MKWSGVPFTHIFERKRYSPSLGCSNPPLDLCSSHDNIGFHVVGFLSYPWNLVSLGLKKSLSISAHPITIVQYNIRQYCAKEFYCYHVKFPCTFSNFHSSSLYVDLTSCIGVDKIFFNICSKSQGHLYPLCVVNDFKPQTLCYSSPILFINLVIIL